ncbi:unnamed protein product, partial [Prorocentrum cordatum]
HLGSLAADRNDFGHPGTALGEAQLLGSTRGRELRTQPARASERVCPGLTSSDVQRGAPWRGDTRLPSAQKAAARRQHRAPAKKGVQLLGGGRRRLRVLHGSWSEFGTGPPPQTTQVARRVHLLGKSRRHAGGWPWPGGKPSGARLADRLRATMMAPRGLPCLGLAPPRPPRAARQESRLGEGPLSRAAEEHSGLTCQAAQTSTVTGLPAARVQRRRSKSCPRRRAWRPLARSSFSSRSTGK